MRVLLVSPNVEQTNMAVLPLGLACVAAATERTGHEVVTVDLMSRTGPRSILRDSIAEFQPEVIGISVRNIDDQNMEAPRFLLEQAKEAVSACREFSDAPIVLGGAGYSIFPDRALRFLGADMGIEGEGEAAFPLLLEHLQRGAGLVATPGLHLADRGLQCPRSSQERLDCFPLPDVRLLSRSISRPDDTWIPVQSRRGCPLRCSYCSTSQIEGCLLRKHSPAVVVDWIEEWREAGFRNFHFVDNTFNLPLTYAKQLCQGLVDRALDIHWWCILYPGNVDEELVGLMAKSGCRQVSLGFESGSNLILKNLRKRFTSEKVATVSRMLADHGIERMGFLMMGSPGETKETVEESLAFADSLNLDQLKLTQGVRIYPNTVLSAVAVEEGALSPQTDLLHPHFYLAKGLEDWLPDVLRNWRASRSYVVG